MKSERQGNALTASQSILEDLLKAQKFEDREVHRGMESKTTLVRAKGGVELHSVTTIDLNLSFVVFPHHSELNHALRN